MTIVLDNLYVMRVLHNNRLLIIIMADDSVAEAQWNAFCSNVVGEWSGLWTFWDPRTGKVRRLLNCVRSFKALNEEKTLIKHQNVSDDPAMSPEHKGPWEIRREDTDENGFCHPAYPQRRAVFLPNGGGVWSTGDINGIDKLGFELFLCQGEHRCSVIVSYDESKQLRLFGTIREKQRTAQIKVWSPSTALRESFRHSDINEDFVGVINTLDKNLHLRSIPGSKWDKSYWLRTKEMDDMENVLIKFLPDTICLSCPAELCTNSFSLRACVLFPNGGEKELQELTVTFVDGQLQSVRQGRYHPGC